MKKQNILEYIIFLLSAIGLAVLLYTAVATQNEALILDRDNLKGLENITVEICEYQGTKISNKCRALDKESGLDIFQAFLSSVATLGPSKTMPIKDEVIRFTGTMSRVKPKRICFIVTSYKSIPGKMFFSSFAGDRECKEIGARQGLYFEADIDAAKW